jgi:hypothetical protein
MSSQMHQQRPDVVTEAPVAAPAQQSGMENQRGNSFAQVQLSEGTDSQQTVPFAEQAEVVGPIVGVRERPNGVTLILVVGSTALGPDGVGREGVIEGTNHIAVIERIVGANNSEASSDAHPGQVTGRVIFSDSLVREARANAAAEEAASQFDADEAELEAAMDLAAAEVGGAQEQAATEASESAETAEYAARVFGVITQPNFNLSVATSILDGLNPHDKEAIWRVVRQLLEPLWAGMDQQNRQYLLQDLENNAREFGISETRWLNDLMLEYDRGH